MDDTTTTAITDLEANKMKTTAARSYAMTCPVCGSAGPFDSNGLPVTDVDATMLCLAPCLRDATLPARCGMPVPEDWPLICGEQFPPVGED